MAGQWNRYRPYEMPPRYVRPRDASARLTQLCCVPCGAPACSSTSAATTGATAHGPGNAVVAPVYITAHTASTATAAGAASHMARRSAPSTAMLHRDPPCAARASTSASAPPAAISHARTCVP